MLSLSDNNQADIIEAFNCTSRYLDDMLNLQTKYLCVLIHIWIKGEVGAVKPV